MAGGMVRKMEKLFDEEFSDMLRSDATDVFWADSFPPTAITKLSSPTWNSV